MFARHVTLLRAAVLLSTIVIVAACSPGQSAVPSSGNATAGPPSVGPTISA